MVAKAWSDEDSALIKQLYVEQEKSVDELCVIFDKEKRNIISKLVQLKVYKKPSDNLPKKKSVKTMIIELEGLLGIEIEGLSLTKKSNLEKVVEAIRTKLEQNQK